MDGVFGKDSLLLGMTTVNVKLWGAGGDTEIGMANTQFKKGLTPWNKGKKGVQVSTRKGIKQAPQSEETKLKRSLSMLGHSISQQTREKIGNANRGKTRTDEEKKRISESLIGRDSPNNRRTV